MALDPTTASGLLQTMLVIFGGVVTTAGGWTLAKVISHGARLSKVEGALKPLYDAISKLGTRADNADAAHLVMTRGLGDVNANLSRLDERSAGFSATLDRMDGRLEKLFEPTAAARTRATRAKA